MIEGSALGSFVGSTVDPTDGIKVVGLVLGSVDGTKLGSFVGFFDGVAVDGVPVLGRIVGRLDGNLVGRTDGFNVTGFDEGL